MNDRPREMRAVESMSDPGTLFRICISTVNGDEVFRLNELDMVDCEMHRTKFLFGRMPANSNSMIRNAFERIDPLRNSKRSFVRPGFFSRRGPHDR